MNKEKIKIELKQTMSKKIDEFVESVANQLSEDKFELSHLEKTIGDSINTYQNLVVNTTEKLLNDKSEKEIISKKKQN